MAIDGTTWNAQELSLESPNTIESSGDDAIGGLNDGWKAPL